VSDPAATPAHHSDEQPIRRQPPHNAAVDDAGARRAPSAADRRNVLWIGGTPPLDLRQYCQTNGLSVVAVAPEPDALRRAAPAARAVVLEIGATFSGTLSDAMRDASGKGAMNWMAPLVAVARLQGLLVAVTHAANMSPQAYYDAAAGLDDPRRVQLPIVVAYREWLEVTRRCVAHDPGPGEHVSLRIEGTLPAGDELRLLLCRAFHDVDAVHIDSVSGGKSGAAVLVVSVAGDEARTQPLPFLVKVNEIAKIREEHQKLTEQARRLIPRRCRPDVHVERCVQGEHLALLVQDFEVGVELLAEIVRRGGNAGVYIPAIFSTALRNFHYSDGFVTGSLSRAFRDLKTLRWHSAALAGAAAVAREVTEVPDVTELRASVEGLPSAQYRQGFVHGDLHIGNVFACGASSEVIVIDFGNVMLGPVVADTACLEVSISFPARDLAAEANGRRQRPRPLDADWLRTAYAYPLDPVEVAVGPRLLGAAGRERAALCDALRTIRSAARESDDSRPAYAVAVASYLLRFAAFDDHADTNERALAYEIACTLVRDANLALQGSFDRDAAQISAAQ